MKMIKYENYHFYIKFLLNKIKCKIYKSFKIKSI